MSLPQPALDQIKKLVNENVNKYFGPLRPTEKTPDKVKAFAQNQLDFFLNGLARQSLELQKEWAKGHPYHVHLRMSSAANRFEIEITEDKN